MINVKNIIPSVITIILLFLFSIFGAFFLLVAMNGYSRSDANTGMIIFVIWVIFTIILFGAGSGFAAGYITAKMEKVRPWVIATGMVIVCSVLGSISISIAVFLGIFFAEISRSSF